jgi:hypothetical protein
MTPVTIESLGIDMNDEAVLYASRQHGRRDLMGVVLKLEVTVLRGVPSKTLWRLSRRRRELVARLRHRWRRVSPNVRRGCSPSPRCVAPSRRCPSRTLRSSRGRRISSRSISTTRSLPTRRLANWDLANAIIAVEWEIRARQVAALERSLCWLAQQSTPGATFDPADEDAVRELVRRAPDLALTGVLLAPQQDPTLSAPVA